MSRRCAITGRGPMAGNNVSHANNKNRTIQRPNLHERRFFVPELGRWVRLKVTTRAIRTIDKKGLLPFLKSEGISLRSLA